jgi:hypothetical protein
MITVYSIAHPITFEVFYIGQTGRFGERRRAPLSEEVASTRAQIAALRQDGLTPIFCPIADYKTRRAALKAETRQILRHRAEGHRTRGITMTPETAERLETMQSTHFARVLDDTGVEKSIAMLSEAAGGSLDGLIERDAETVTVRAPDGDAVFLALRKEPGAWICRLHREVFTE